MEAVIAEDDLLPAGKASRELDRAFDGLRPAVGEEDAREGIRCVLRDLLGDLARLRSPLNIRWVLTWAKPVAAKGLRRVQHLFRRLDRYSWMFFHDSFRRFVLEETSVDALGEPDAAADARRHAFLAGECAKAPANS